MIQSDELPVLLPENFFYESVLRIVPCLKVIEDESSGIAGIGIEAPECEVEVILTDQLADIGHPGQVRFLHKAAPLTDKDRRDAVVMDIQPVIVPAVCL